MGYSPNPIDPLYDLAMAMKRLFPGGRRGRGFTHPAGLEAWCVTLLRQYPGADGRKAQEVAYYLANLRFGGNTVNRTFREAWAAACAAEGVPVVWTDFARKVAV
jgi:hypothetical protein